MNDHPTRHPYSANQAETSHSLGSGARPSPVVLIADDETHIRLVVGEKFRSEGFTVIEARDGEEALELVNANLPDVIVTDLQMPHMNGIELCTRIAADPRTSHIPALLLTARGHIVDNAQLSTTVIRKIMAKPFSAKALFENTQNLLATAVGGKSDNAIAASATFKRPQSLPP